jgi:MerR family transcriptional regulator, thiopeptide resistance regulator
MDWSIQEVAALTGTTSRTLRHYGAIGLLAPTRVGSGGARHYDEDALVRLQRILLLRELGLGLARIGEVLDATTSEERALRAHVDALRRERARIERQIVAVEKTIATRREGGELMAHDMFDGFDHTEYEAEVTERWGPEAYARSDAWWRGMDTDEKAAWKTRTADLARDWVAAAEAGEPADGPRARSLAERHVAWLTAVPGTPARIPGDIDGYVRGLADMYVADPRFGRTYATSAGGSRGAEYVRDALHAYLDAQG